ncbi:hypothetical protein BH09VER1_BH09VER1_37040 [soil metagenome]
MRLPLIFSRRLSLTYGLAALASAGLAHGETSKLFGKDGELWDRAGRLTDFSYAGYHSGEAPLPRPPVKANVKDFGAKGDGVTDDTEAFRQAIEKTDAGAILIPAGKYVLKDILEIRKPNIVLRGEGPDKTTLFFPLGLEQVRPSASATTTGLPTSAYSWSGGFLWIKGEQKGAWLGNVAVPAARGTHVIELDRAPKVSVGDKIEITQEDAGDGSLSQHLYQGQSDSTSAIKFTRTRFVSRVEKIDGTKITLERALRTEVNPQWKAVVKTFAPSVSEVGIEDLCFEFANVPYRGHFKEDGFNPIAVTGAADCWVRHIRILNADSGPFLNGSSFVTLDGLVFESSRQPTSGGETGHHGVTLGEDNLLTNFDFRCKFIHDISVEGTAGSVASKGRGVDLCFDHHKRFPHANLFTEIDLGAGTRPYHCGGGDNLGRNSAAWTTFWNLRSKAPISRPPTSFAPDLINIVGVFSKEAPILDPKGVWFEPIDPASLEPANLYEAQKALRLKARK